MAKGLRRSPTKGNRSAAKTSVKGRRLEGKAMRPKAKRAVAAKPAAKAVAKKTTKAAVTRKKAAKVVVKPTKKAESKRKVAASPKAKVTKKSAAKKPVSRKVEASKPKKFVTPRVKTTQKLAAVRAPKPATVTPPPPRQPTLDESAALRAFERAHKEFTHGHFSEARNQFRILLDKYSQVAEVAARSRTYLAIAEARLRTESMLPRDADSLYDRGVIELNRGEYVAAQEMFERALKREPEAAHIHYGLAATRARLGSVDLALQSLQRALDLQPNLRVRAQHDHDLTALRNDPDFDKLIFQPRV